jgi:hypothetical protein
VNTNDFRLLLIPFALNILGLLLAVTFGGEVPKMWVTFRSSANPWGWFAGFLFTLSVLACTSLSVTAAWYLAGGNSGLHFAPFRPMTSEVINYINQLLFPAKNEIAGRGVLTVLVP